MVLEVGESGESTGTDLVGVFLVLVPCSVPATIRLGLLGLLTLLVVLLVMATLLIVLVAAVVTSGDGQD